MVRAIVLGACGRMGQRIVNMILHQEGIELAGAVERPGHPQLGADAGIVGGAGQLGVAVGDSLDAVIDEGDVVIDFTAPDCTLAAVELAASKGKAMVIGTTGIRGDALENLRGKAAHIPCVLSPNMSVGVNVMFRIVGELAAILGRDYDMEILEVHHRMKKDAPSGTAMRLAQILADAVGRDLDRVGVYERRGMIGERTREEIGIQTWRAGDITGEHTVLFGGIGERLELTHRAHNRDNFARGAVRAALWVVGKPPGLYDMQDVLGLG